MDPMNHKRFRKLIKICAKQAQGAVTRLTLDLISKAAQKSSTEAKRYIEAAVIGSLAGVADVYEDKLKELPDNHNRMLFELYKQAREHAMVERRAEQALAQFDPSKQDLN